MEPQKRKRYIVKEVAPILCVVCTIVHGGVNDGDTKTRVNDVSLGEVRNNAQIKKICI